MKKGGGTEEGLLTKAPEEESLIPESTAAPADGSSSKLSSSKASGASLFKPEEEKAEKPGNLLSHLSDFLYQKLRFGNDEEPVHILDEPTIDGIVRYIKSGKCKNIIAMIGAGISTAAGIPDFRSPNSGINSKLGKFNLPSPEAIFEIGYFRHKATHPSATLRVSTELICNTDGLREGGCMRNPAPFYALARQLFPKNLKPTLSHCFLRLLHQKGLLLRLYTQNIDCLERLAGIPAEAIVEAHGTFHTSHCLSCNCEYSLDWLRDIVFFGERLPDRFFDLSEECEHVKSKKMGITRRADKSMPRCHCHYITTITALPFLELITDDFARCDLLLIVGTSLQVQPFAGLVDKVHNSIPRLLINLEKCGQDNLVSKILGLGCGLDFDSEANFRDVALIGTCDNGCREMADRLGWKDDLMQLIDQVEVTNAEQMASQQESQHSGISTVCARLNDGGRAPRSKDSEKTSCDAAAISSLNAL
ncbi:sirtuin 2 isoform X4 [Rhipicephalus microplus]|uniref:sirtuin 2 isoform X4 n=1 Tax=Rhipicephalus microplus TaxID=6941 RepID=UPI003F6D7550